MLNIRRKFGFFLFLLHLITSVSFAQKAQILSLDTNLLKVEKINVLNSKLRETNLSLTPNGRFLYFMSNRGGQKWSQKYGTFKNQLRYDGDIWYSEKEGKEWKNPVCLSRKINSPNGEDEPNIGQDGQSFFFQSWNSSWKQTGGPYYSAEMIGDDWENIRGLGGGINSFFVRNFNQYEGFATDGMSVSPDQKWLMIALAPHYEDKMDLYIAKRDASGNWLEPEKCSLSSQGDERSVFIAADGVTVFFASDGYGGFGGLDIFKSVLQPDGTFSSPVNIGAPFNTPEDDYNFIINAAGDEAFFVRDGDIYRVLFEKKSPLTPEPVILIEGIITEGCEKKPVSALIAFSETGTDLPLCNLRSNALTGRFSLAHNGKKGGRYLLKFMHAGKEIKKFFELVAADGFKHYEINFHLDCDDLQLSMKNAEQLTPVTPKLETVPTVYFDFNSDEIPEKYRAELDIFASKMEKSNQRITLIGHTDNVGNFSYNQELALRRAVQVKNYLVIKGIDAARITTESKSFAAPEKSNETEEGRAFNRRVQIVLSF
jgi:outer membrane protein OmpA-like peptidoglycan-associated protein